MLPLFASSHEGGGGQKKISYIIRGEGIEKMFKEKKL